MKVISMLQIFHLVCFAVLFIANALRFGKEMKELNLTPALTALTISTVIIYGLYLMELFTAWYGKNAYESYSLNATFSLILIGTILSLCPLLGWIKPIQSNLFLYTLILSACGIWLIISHTTSAA